MSTANPVNTESFTLQEVHPNPADAVLQNIGRCSIHIISALYWETAADWDMGERHSADDFFFIPISGAMLFNSTQKTQQTIAPGSCLCLPEGARCTVNYAPGCNSIGVFAIHARVSDAHGLPLLQQLKQYVLPFNLDWTHSLRSLVSIYNQDQASGNQFGKNIIRLLLSAWALNGIAIHSSENYDPRISKALQIIHQHFSGDIHVAGIASEVGLGIVQFRKLFKQQLQQSPKLYIAHYRLRQAAQALQRQNESIKQIAYQCGFQDEHYFHNSFKRFFNCTPTQYRQQVVVEA